jgi:hypothetical protein
MSVQSILGPVRNATCSRPLPNLALYDQDAPAEPAPGLRAGATGARPRPARTRPSWTTYPGSSLTIPCSGVVGLQSSRGFGRQRSRQVAPRGNDARCSSPASSTHPACTDDHACSTSAPGPLRSSSLARPGSMSIGNWGSQLRLTPTTSVPSSGTTETSIACCIDVGVSPREISILCIDARPGPRLRTISRLSRFGAQMTTSAERCRSLGRYGAKP